MYAVSGVRNLSYYTRHAALTFLIYFVIYVAVTALSLPGAAVMTLAGGALFTLRLVPIFPFFVINLVMGLTPIRVLVFYIVIQLGMLPGTLVYVNAGTQLSQIDSLQGILSSGLILSFVLFRTTSGNCAICPNDWWFWEAAPSVPN